MKKENIARHKVTVLLDTDLYERFISRVNKDMSSKNQTIINALELYLNQDTAKDLDKLK